MAGLVRAAGSGLSAMVRSGVGALARGTGRVSQVRHISVALNGSTGIIEHSGRTQGSHQGLGDAAFQNHITTPSREILVPGGGVTDDTARRIAVVQHEARQVFAKAGGKKFTGSTPNTTLIAPNGFHVSVDEKSGQMTAHGNEGARVVSAWMENGQWKTEIHNNPSIVFASRRKGFHLLEPRANRDVLKGSGKKP